MRVALCYWGLCRSTDKTIQSIEQCIYEPLRKANIKYDVYIHTFTIDGKYSNAYAKEESIQLNNNLYLLLKPTDFIVENQDAIDKKLHFESYRTKGLSPRWLTTWNKTTVSEMTNNHIRALYSLNEVTKLWKKPLNTYDCIIYLRPDVRFIRKLDTEWLNKLLPNECLLPDYAKYPINDQFAILKPENAVLYGQRYEYLLEYSKINSIHAEEYLNYILKKNSMQIREINFRFGRIRANGVELFDYVQA
jgi:hypothetical protein